MPQDYDYPEYYEHPQLHQAALMRLILRAAAVRAQSRRDLVETIFHEMKRVDELTGHRAPAVSRVELSRKVRHAGKKLSIAGLLQEMEDGCCRLTGSGRRMLSDHPQGIDDSVLMASETFRDFIHRESHAMSGNMHVSSRDSGHAAFENGKDVTDNPYPYDSAAHFSWSEGWFEAADESSEHHS